MAMAAGRYVHMRASTADRDRSIEVLKTSFIEGRLTRDELDLRLGQAFISRFFAQLMAITADLPVGPFGRLPAHPVTPPFPRTRGRTIATAVAVLVLGGLAALALLVLAVGVA
jgi:Domain of unknown function (DUF1707)